MKHSPTVRANLELLGVEIQAGPNELKRAYHRLAMLYHPDRNPDPHASEEFRKITQAYEFLSDPAQVADANRRHLKERLHRVVVEGLDFTFGSFFGYRLFHPEGRDPKALKLSGKASGKQRSEEEWPLIEENDSILDHAAYDAIEVVYAGKHSIEDEAKLSSGGKKRADFSTLPWVVLNNQGLLRFLDGDIRKARKCYEELSERIPGNIIFLYRWGLCLIIEGFKQPRRTLLGGMKPDRIKIDRGLALLQACVKIGEERTFGRQKCQVIKKTIADVYEKTGRKKKAKTMWKKIREEDPNCAEAAFRLSQNEVARELALKKSQTTVKPDASSSLLLTTSRD